MRAVVLSAIEAWMHKPGQAAYPRTRVRGRGGVRRSARRSALRSSRAVRPPLPRIWICEQVIDRLSERADLFAGLSRSGGGIDDLKVMGDCGRLGESLPMPSNISRLTARWHAQPSPVRPRRRRSLTLRSHCPVGDARQDKVLCCFGPRMETDLPEHFARPRTSLVSPGYFHSE